MVHSFAGWRSHAAGQSFFSLLVGLTVGLVTSPTLAESASKTADAVSFNRDIRPLLSDNCFSCHGPDANQRQADLRLDVRDAAIEFGAIVPGEPADSPLVERLHETDPELVMPPPESHKKLSPAQKQLLARWIEEGATYKPHWAFVAPQRPEPPPVTNPAVVDWPHNAIDQFILAKLTAAGLQPSPEADRATLIRRLHADLTGLPPTPAEVDAFVADRSPNAYEQLVDRLLASPHYGERMAAAWLDAARYADSNGFQQDGDTYQYVWRDWVVQALNDDMPFDTFTTQQLAGDLLPDATLDQKIASAFNRNHMLNGEGGAIAEEQRNVILFDRVDVTSTVWLGLTMACAQCHDHKYDPLTMTDYYGFFAFFNNVPEAGVPKNRFGVYRLDNPWVFAPNDDQQQRLDAFDTLITQTEKAVQERLASSAFKAAMKAWETKIVEGSQPTLQWTTWHSINGFASPSYDAAFDETFGPENGVDLHASFDEGKRTWQAQAEWNDGVVHNWDAANNETIYLFREVTSDRPVHLNVSLGSDDGIRVWLNNKFIKEERAKRAAAADQLFVNLPLDKGNNRLLIKIINASGSAGFYFRPNMKVIPDDVLAVLKIDTSARTAAQQAKAHDYFLNHAAPSDVTALVHKVKNQSYDLKVEKIIFPPNYFEYHQLSFLSDIT